MSKSKFQYVPPSADAVRASSEERRGFDSYLKNFPKFSVREGKNHIRILPATWEDARYFGLEIGVIFNLGVDQSNYISPSFMDRNAEDPIAEERSVLMREGDKETADKLRPRARFLFWVIDRDEESAGPKVFSAPVTLNREIASLMIDESTGEALQIDHPEEGYDVYFTKTGSGLKTKYTGVKIARASSPISDDDAEQEEWLAYIMENPLPDVINIYDAEYLSSVLEGKSSTSIDDEDDDIPIGGNGHDADEGLDRLKAKEDEDDGDEPEPRTRRRISRTRSGRAARA